MKWITWLPALLLLLALPAVAEEYRDVRDRFEEVFQEGREPGDRRQAVLDLAAFDTKEAAQVLLSGIAISDGILEPYAVRRKDVEAEIQRIEKDQIFETQRTYPEEQSKKLKELKAEAQALRGLIDGELMVLEAIEQSLGATRDPKAVEHLYRNALSREKHWRSREITARALEVIAAPEAVKFLVRALKDKDDRVQSTVALTLGKLKAAEAADELVKLLGQKVWTVRAAAIEALGEIGEKRVVKALIDQMEKEEGRLQLDCATALSKLTGQKFGAMPEAWKRWWEDHKEEYGGEEGAPLGGHPAPPRGGGDGGYYGIPIVTEKAIFILDISGSMAKSAKDAGRDPQAGETSKIESAKAELTRALHGFSPRGKFDVIVFNDTLKKWKDTMVPATRDNKEAAKTWVKDLSAASSTNIYDALGAAFQVAGMGASDKHYDLAADTIFLLSDGSPTKPDGSMDDWEKILRAVSEWNRLKRVTIHAIGIGGHNVAFMSRLASENGGTYVAR